MDITERVLRMVDPQQFDELFEQEMGKHPTYKKAFQKLNQEYREAFGRNRYKDWESYRVTRWQREKT